MNHNHNYDRAAEPPLEPVEFQFTHPTARAVYIAGTFNDWHPEAKPMHPVGNGRWVKKTVLPPGTYEYCLVVDRKWTPDPLVQETVPTPFGGMNSVLRVS